jgi:hypothetical protein
MYSLNTDRFSAVDVSQVIIDKDGLGRINMKPVKQYLVKFGKRLSCSFFPLLTMPSNHFRNPNAPGTGPVSPLQS